MEKRNIKKRTEFQALIDSNDEIKSRFKRGFHEYDAAGNLLKDVTYNQRGEIENATGYTFDGQGRLVEEIHYYEGGETGEQIRYKLDQDGKRVEIETTYADGSVSLKKISRFENMVSIKSFDEDGDFESEHLLKYNEDGKILEETQFDEDRQIVTRENYTYDGQHRLKSKTVYEGNNEFIEKIVLDYDHHDRVVQERHLNRKDEVVRQLSFEFDSDGNQVAWQSNQHLTQTTYDKRGNPVKEEVINRGNGLVENFMEFKYNDHGLLIEERTFTMGEEYELEPGVKARTQSAFIVHAYEYEFFEE